jgi:UDP-N-acetylglucosamine--N-acetylmuramyl-(pentapeptide) pyrophosphoryl-undecaprenol N-acetylglucosamine transferase
VKTGAPEARVVNHRDAMPRIIIGGVGTGGHYFPAVVVAQELQRRKFDVIFLARTGCLEEDVAHRYGIKTFPIKSRPFFGKSVTGKIHFIVSLFYSIVRLNGLTRDSIGMAFGGFGAAPLAISCMINRSAFYIFEANRVPGRASKLFASSAKKVFLGLPPVNRLKGNTMLTGIPVRKEFREAVRAQKRYEPGTAAVLFYGGSQGARRLNDLALELQETMPKKWRLTLITGNRDYARVVPRRGKHTRVLPFVEEPWQEISEADVIGSRAGALAGYEILSVNKKVIFIPFPYAVDDHQYHNAVFFSRVGNAMVHEEKGLTADILTELVGELLKKKGMRRATTIRDAEKRIADCLVQDVKHARI